MTLTDAGPIVALIDSRDSLHSICVEATKDLEPGPLVTTWPCFTEAMYLLFRKLGAEGQAGTVALATRRTGIAAFIWCK